MPRSKPMRLEGKVRRLSITEYHVVPNGKRWDVERDDAFVGSFAYEVNIAIDWAVSAAQRDHKGLDVMVCVQQPDGTCKEIWP
jgi:hypothetical protein